MKHTLIRNVEEEAPAESFSGCGHGPAPAARRASHAPPIFVNSVAIPETAIAQEAQNHQARTGAEARAAAARALVIRELLLQRAAELELVSRPIRDEAGREETDDEALIRMVLEREAPVQDPTEEECRRVYEASQSRFVQPELYAASHILIAPGEEADTASAVAEAQARRLIGALNDGASFEDLARAWSACSSGADGGALGQMRRGDLAPELEDALLVLDEGVVAPSPVRTRYGWHVIRLDRRAPSAILPFDAVHEAIRASLRARASIAASARYLQALAAGAEIEGLTLEFGAAG